MIDDLIGLTQIQDAEARAAELRSELRARLGEVREQMCSQRERVSQLLGTFQVTTDGVQAMRISRAPRLFAREQLILGGAVIEVARQTVRHAEGSHRFTPTEWQLLTFLIANPDVVHSRLELASGAWGSGFAERSSEVEVYVSRLRRKLGPAARLLETVRGSGYRLLLERAPVTSLARAVITPVPALEDESPEDVAGAGA